MVGTRPSYIALAIAIGLGLGLVFAELGVRVYRYGPDSLIPSVMNSLHPIGTSGMIRQSIPELGYELKPDLDELYKKVPLRTNSAGLRDRVLPLQHDDDQPGGPERRERERPTPPLLWTLLQNNSPKAPSSCVDSNGG